MLRIVSPKKYISTVLAILLLVSMLVTACAPASQPTPAPVETEAPAAVATEAPTPAATEAPTEKPAEPAEVETPATPESAYSEAPMLAEQVAAGTLPIVDERLPQNPAVVTPAHEIGKYGGELRFGFVGGSPEWGGMLYLSGWEHPTIWKADFSGVVPNLFENLEANADASVWTGYLRRGMKWSDGADFTAADIAFYIEDVLGNEELSPGGISADWLPGDMAETFTFSKVDDYTVKFDFGKSYGTFPLVLAQWQGRQFAMYPRHYLEQFHADYNADVDDLMAAEGVDTWMALFFMKGPDTWGNPGRWMTELELPSLYAYVVTQPMGTGTQIVMERNPYYWKVDPAGNQLPYIDRIIGYMYQDDEARTLAMLNGDLDVLKDPGDNETKALYIDAIDRGGPLFLTPVLPEGANGVVLQFNFTHPTKGEVFANKDFRIGVSYALDREELIELFNDGQGYPSQVCPLPDSPLAIAACNDQYIEFDPDKATEYLDKVFTEGKDADGYYLWNGQRFSIVLIAVNDWTWAPRQAELGEVLAGYMQDVGLDVQLNAMPGDNWGQARLANEVEAFISTGEGGAGITAMLDPRNYVPMEHFGMYANAWALWRLNEPEATGAQEPPQWVLDARQKYYDAIGKPTADGQIAAMREVIQEATDRFYQIGAYQGGDGWYPWHTRLGNVYDEWYGGWIEGVLKILYPEQWYITD